MNLTAQTDILSLLRIRKEMYSDAGRHREGAHTVKKEKKSSMQIFFFTKFTVFI